MTSDLFLPIPRKRNIWKSWSCAWTWHVYIIYLIYCSISLKHLHMFIPLEASILEAAPSPGFFSVSGFVKTPDLNSHMVSFRKMFQSQSTPLVGSHMGPMWAVVGYILGPTWSSHMESMLFGQGAFEGPKWVYPTGSEVGFQGTHMGLRQNWFMGPKCVQCRLFCGFPTFYFFLQLF